MIRPWNNAYQGHRTTGSTSIFPRVTFLVVAAMSMPSEAPAIASNALVLSPPPGDDALPLRAAAKAAHISESTLRRLVQDGAVDVVRGQGGSIRISQSTVVELRSGAIRRGPPSIAGREADRARGELAAGCFTRFNAGKDLIAIVEELHASPAAVKALWTEWIDLQETQRKSIVLRCHHANRGGECDGAPLANVSMCGRHAARAHHLTDEQAAILSGREIATALHCSSCDTMAARGVCSACMSAVTIMVEGAGAGRRLVVRTRGGKVIAIGAATESRALARQLLVETDPPPIDVTTADPPMSVVSAADILAHLQLEIEAERTEG